VLEQAATDLGALMNELELINSDQVIKKLDRLNTT
jgi:hypothetical protein